MVKKKLSLPTTPETLDLYRSAIAGNPHTAIKGATMPYTSHNGHMYSFLSKDGMLSIRLPQGARDEFISKFKTALSEQHGVVMKEYVVVPEELLRKTKELGKYMKLSFEYINSLKPKTVKR